MKCHHKNHTKPASQWLRNWKSMKYKDSIWTADLDEMVEIYFKNCYGKYLLCVIDVFTKYAWVKHSDRFLK